eukprot:13979253-Ditylum_brightwellii.AAC.1
MKVIWNHHMVLVAEKTGMLGPLQFGNRKGQTVLDALLLKVVTMDCLMIPELFSLHVQSLGLPDNATKCSVLLNHGMKHFVKTNTGITKDFYKHKPTNEKFGEGQGKTSS